MSPKGLVALLLVGLCATQMASAFRNSREVEKLLDTAEAKLEGALADSKDAAGSSMETVVGFMQRMEANVLRAGSEKLAALGFPVDLVTIAELFKSNINSCVTNDAVKAKAQGIIGEMSSCISKDAESLKGLMKNMQDLWSTAKTLPSTMKTIAGQCSEHGEKDIPEIALEAEVVPPKDESNHVLAPVVNEIMEEAALSRDKRWLWGLSRVTRCVKSVFSLARNDLVTAIPGQILSTATNAYNVFKTATTNGEIPKCIQNKTAEVLPTLKVLTSEVGTCLSSMDLDAIIAANPKLAGLKNVVDLALKFSQMPASALGGASAAIGALAGDVANGGVGGVASGVAKLLG